jgi:hypothetical protein
VVGWERRRETVHCTPKHFRHRMQQRTQRGLVTQSDTTAADRADMALINAASSLEGGNPSRSLEVVIRCLTKLYTWVGTNRKKRDLCGLSGLRHSVAHRFAFATPRFTRHKGHTHREVQRPEERHNDSTGGVAPVEACGHGGGNGRVDRQPGEGNQNQDGTLRHMNSRISRGGGGYHAPRTPSSFHIVLHAVDK